jgi:hypothetical protein
MVYKMIDVDGKKWNTFRKWCAANDTTMKAEVDLFLNKYCRGKSCSG